MTDSNPSTPDQASSARPLRVAIIGGGAAGFFAAIHCAERLQTPGQLRSIQVFLYEGTAHPLSKVLISGGGRCNVTHACFDPRELSKRYPRGSRELIGPFSKWGPRQMVDWFAAQGVELKTEEDGRMFPVTDSSQTIVDCLRLCAERAGVSLTIARPVLDVQKRPEGGFTLSLSGGTSVVCDRLLIATGGTKDSTGIRVARTLGHTIEEQVPSLFTFKIDDPRLIGLSGLATQRAGVQILGTKLREEGPVLITHWGLSGPAILRVSAWGARELASLDYQLTARINWCPPHTVDSAIKELQTARANNPKKQLATWCPLGVPLRLWEKLIPAAGLQPTAIWTGISNDGLKQLARQLCESDFKVEGKASNKEEFVTCGGVKLSEVDFKTMQSKVCPGLFFAGEVLDIDGITGGFNFQAAWTTGWLAAQALSAP